MPKITPLTPGEAQILQAASQIYSGMLASGKLTQTLHKDKMDSCIKSAIYLYNKIDSVVASQKNKPIS